MKLTDRYGRRIKDLRISVTPRCNFHCVYCHPLGLEMTDPPGTVSVADVAHFVRAGVILGAESVRFTGGEPLVRKELPEMIAAAREAGVEDVAVTTNGTLLKRRLPELMVAARDPEVFRRLTRGGDIEKVWEGIEAALSAGLHPVKLNAVVIRGENDGEVVPLAELTLERPLHMRYIEYMHLNNAPFEEYRAQFVPGAETRRRIEAAFGALEPVSTDPSSPARVFRVPGALGTVGFINPVSEPFCSNCSRLRLTSDKKLRPCLLTELELDIAPAFEAEDPVEALLDAILGGADQKPAFGNTLPTKRQRVMLGIGG